VGCAISCEIFSARLVGDNVFSGDLRLKGAGDISLLMDALSLGVGGFGMAL
jgi:hypothetical protein